MKKPFTQLAAARSPHTSLTMTLPAGTNATGAEPPLHHTQAAA